jgi:hypothetical protein
LTDVAAFSLRDEMPIPACPEGFLALSSTLALKNYDCTGLPAAETAKTWAVDVLNTTAMTPNQCSIFRAPEYASRG